MIPDFGISKSLAEITHGIVAVNKADDIILEFIGYWSEPTPDCIAEAQRELDELYGSNTYIMYHATPDMIRHFTTPEFFDE